MAIDLPGGQPRACACGGGAVGWAWAFSTPCAAQIRNLRPADRRIRKLRARVALDSNLARFGPKVSTCDCLGGIRGSARQIIPRVAEDISAVLRVVIFISPVALCVCELLPKAGRALDMGSRNKGRECVAP